MNELLNNIHDALLGDHRTFPLEQRLFNALSLLNGVTNILGGLGLMYSRDSRLFAVTHLATGAGFLLCFYLSRFRRIYRPLYWPFVMLMVSFVFFDTLSNAGTRGGSHYYFIAAMVIAIILSNGARTTLLAASVICASSVALFIVERQFPQWIAAQSAPGGGYYDIAGNFLFVQLFVGALVIIQGRELEAERRKSDTLLLNILPESVAQELKTRDRVEPRAYHDATILFTDFVGFTRVAEGLTPREVVEELDDCFRGFDRIARAHGLEKIKTIGDSYMAVGGIPQPSRTHAADCVLAALEMRDFIAARVRRAVERGQPFWDVRIGINSGELVAGVIGREKFAYDVWGDAVNTASRMESSGQPGRVNVSRATYESVKDLFECEPRGAIEAKSKGRVEMFFVNRVLPELSVDGDGHGPSDKFHERLRGAA